MTELALFRTDHSLHEGSNKVGDYVARAAAHGIKSLIMADRCSLAGAITFYKKCHEYNINPIMGTLFKLYDQEKVYAAQSARNGLFFSKLYHFLTELSGFNIGETFVADNYALIENEVISTIHKTASSAKKSIAIQYKESSEHWASFAESIGVPDVAGIIRKSAGQAGYFTSIEKKKYADLGRVSLQGDLDLDEKLCANYITAYITLSEHLRSFQSFDKESITATIIKNQSLENIWGYFAQQVGNEYASWADKIKDANSGNDHQINLELPENNTKKTKKPKTKQAAKRQEYSFSAYMNELVSAYTKASKLDQPSYNAFSQNSIPPTECSLISNECSKKNSSTALTAYHVIKKIHALMQENPFYLKPDGDAVTLSIDAPVSELERDFLSKIKTSSIITEAILLYLIEHGCGAFRPYPMTSSLDALDKDGRELRCHVAYLALLDEAAEYKAKNESCYSDITIFAKNQAGFLNLKSLISLAFSEGQEPDLIEIVSKKRKTTSFPKLSIRRLREFSDGLVAIIGLQNDEVDKAFKYGNDLNIQIDYYASIFGKENVLVGVQRSTNKDDGEFLQSLEQQRNHALVEAAKKTNTVAFALNNAFFLEQNDYDVMDTKAAILEDEFLSSISRERDYFHGHYLKSSSEFAALFADCQTLYGNMTKLSEHFLIGQHLNIELDKPVLPQFPIPDGYTESSYMKHLAEKGMWEKFTFNLLREYGVESLDDLNQSQVEQVESLKKVFQERLDYEVGVISRMGFSGYFLIVADFIVWGKNNGVPIGAGRGSGAGSIVAYGLNITDVDPIKYGLLFERFLNPDRVSMPDFDVDFGAGFHPETGVPVNRDSVIEYVQNKYNNPELLFPSVGQIATHGLIAAKSGIKKLGKVKLLLPSFTDRFTKLLPEDPELNIGKCLDVTEVVSRKEREREVNELLEMTGRLEGLKQSSGVHAGGVVIAPKGMVDFAPFQIDIRNPTKPIAQFDKNDVETAGLVKFDFLGLANLTTIEICRKYIRQFKDTNLDMSKIDYSDPATFDLLRSGNSHGVFQVESDGMKKLLKRISCDNMEDLSALLALYRPGPIQSGMVDNFVDRKHGREKISYPDANYQHDCLKTILEPTYGIILYQEQVMQCAQAMAGYTLGGADLLRRAMGKKKPEEMAKQGEVFKEGAVANGIDPELAMKIFFLIEKFAGYGFNKSHSMAYAHITFQTAFLKTHYLTEYMAALLTDQSTDTDKLKLTLIDCKRNGITILPPDINRSCVEFLPEGEGVIRYGLSAIKGVGEEKLLSILQNRNKNGHFTSIEDIRTRCGSVFDKKVAEGLLFSGALDSLKTELTLDNGALRKEKDIPRIEATTPRLEELNSQLRAESLKIKEITTKGRVLREMISSLMNYYSSRYALPLPQKDLQKNSEFNEVAAYLLSELPNAVSRGADAYGVSEDIKNLRAQLEARQNATAEFIEANKLANEIKRQLGVEKDELSITKEEQGVDGERLAALDKRAYLLKDIEMYVQTLKIKDLTTDKLQKTKDDHTYKGIDRLTDAYRLKQEMAYLAYYVTGHPFDINNLRTRLSKTFFQTPISQLTYPELSHLDESERYEVIRETPTSRVAGVVADCRLLKIKKETSKLFGKDMAIVSLDDASGEMTVVLMPEMYQAVKSNLFVGAPLAIEGVVTKDLNSAEDLRLTVMPQKIYDPSNIESLLYEAQQFKKKK